LASETFIHLIDEIAASQEEGRRDRLHAEQILAEQMQASGPRQSRRTKPCKKSFAS